MSDSQDASEQDAANQRKLLARKRRASGWRWILVGVALIFVVVMTAPEGRIQEATRAEVYYRDEVGRQLVEEGAPAEAIAENEALERQARGDDALNSAFAVLSLLGSFIFLVGLWKIFRANRS